MKAHIGRIRIILLLAVLLCAESCQRSPIPLRTMKRIYSDMMIADVSLETKPDLYTGIDSLGVYPAIFAKYGYTTDQFLAAQEYLISHPDKFIKMAEQIKKMWDEKSAIAERDMSVRDSLADIEYEKQQAIQAEIDNFLDSISFACLLDTIKVGASADTSAVSAKTAADSSVSGVKTAADSSMKPEAKVDSVKKRVPAKKILKTDE